MTDEAEPSTKVELDVPTAFMTESTATTWALVAVTELDAKTVTVTMSSATVCELSNLAEEMTTFVKESPVVVRAPAMMTVEQLLEVCQQRLDLANERAAVAADRAAANEQLALVAQRWSEWYNHQMMIMAQQRADESLWHQEAVQRASFEAKQTVDEAVAACTEEADRRILSEIEHRRSAEQSLGRAEKLLSEAQERIADLVGRLSEVDSQEDGMVSRREAADGQDVPNVGRVSELKHETPDRCTATQLADAASMMFECTVSSMTQEAVVAVRSCGAVKESELSRRSVAKKVVESCIRCGGCGHRHEQCRAKAGAVIWCIDWSERRKSRKRRREAQKRGKNVSTTACGAVKAKLTVGVTGVVDKAEVKGESPAEERNVGSADAYRDSFFEDVGDTETIGAVRLVISKRLQQERELNRSRASKESEGSTKNETSTNGCLEEVGKIKECERGLWRLGQDEPFKEVATDGHARRRDQGTIEATPEW